MYFPIFHTGFTDPQFPHGDKRIVNMGKYSAENRKVSGKTAQAPPGKTSVKATHAKNGPVQNLRITNTQLQFYTAPVGFFAFYSIGLVPVFYLACAKIALQYYKEVLKEEW